MRGDILDLEVLDNSAIKYHFWPYFTDNCSNYNSVDYIPIQQCIANINLYLEFYNSIQTGFFSFLYRVIPVSVLALFRYGVVLCYPGEAKADFSEIYMDNPPLKLSDSFSFPPFSFPIFYGIGLK